MEPLLAPKDVAERMSLSVRQVRQLISQKQLRHVAISGRRLVPEAAIAEFLRRHMVEALPHPMEPQVNVRTDTSFSEATKP